ncbi:MAG: antitoxin [Chloroflexi bacterium HGW-Chloroflexi-1]|nr:MAG: antitoxin [Chloroflexi bacterium HGW-Chloroflexi-1]
MNEQPRQYITIDPRVMAGKPVIRGTRIPVELVVCMLAQDIPESNILREYPRWKPEDIRAALTYATDALVYCAREQIAFLLNGAS